MRNVAIILAGGTGSRVGGKTPKQLLPLHDGRSILEHSVDAFEQAECIDEIAIVMHPDFIEEAEELRKKNTWRKVTNVIAGGSERWESSWHAIEAYSAQPSPICLWLHDCARPFVSQRILTEVAEALKEHAAVTVAIPVTDTLYKVESLKLKVESIPSRSEYMRAQTPQAFHLNILKEAFERALRGGKMIVTDDAGVVLQYMPEQPIVIVTGDEANKKITYKEDLGER
jgi:2-C-methyl-D-erythritol 4-phosphate cytidylyltransferase